jgi:hypothetical protein
VSLTSTSRSIIVQWLDEARHRWQIEYSLNPDSALITNISIDGSTVIHKAHPYFQCSTGKRHGGWNAFFDFPPGNAEGTHLYSMEFKLTAAKARTVGDRVELTFDGLRMGIFSGSIRYVIFPGTRLIQQTAVVRTTEPDTAYIYDAGIDLTEGKGAEDIEAVPTQVSYYDTEGNLRDVDSDPSLDRHHILSVRYRTLAVGTGAGSVAVFPPPHQYFFPRDFTTNLGYVWYSAQPGLISLGTRQPTEDGSRLYPWVNAPPDSEQHLSLFLLLSADNTHTALADVAKLTHDDRFPRLEHHITLTAHWHFAYTVQAEKNGFAWSPPFKPVLQSLGVDAAMLMDFHGDGHPEDTSERRLRELHDYYEACRTQSGPDFLLIPAEEANVFFGGHWALAFPHPVYWHMSREPARPFLERNAEYGKVYNVGSSKELLSLVRAERAFVYQTHPRTKGSTGFPDQILQTPHFLDPHYFGAGWKALPSDLSSPRLGDRAFRLLDELSSLGLKKRLLGEVDVFQIDGTHELYAHMNVNYVKVPKHPAFDEYGQVLEAVRRGQFFVSTGEVLLPDFRITVGRNGSISVHARILNTFPLQMAEVVWGDGSQVHQELFPLTTRRAFEDFQFSIEIKAKGWRWARFGVWDVAANGAFVNPVWRSEIKATGS